MAPFYNLSMTELNQITALVTIGRHSEFQVPTEKPIRRLVWNEAPQEPVAQSIRSRLAEFWRGEEVPPHLKAMGILSADMFVDASEGLGLSSFKTSLYTGEPLAGEPTIYGVSLYEDRVDVALSSIHDYGNFSVQVFSLPLRELDAMTGHVASQLAQDRLEMVATLLDVSTSNHTRSSAKVSLMRYLAQARPGSVKRIGEMGGLLTTGVAYTVDGKTKAIKLYISEIPDTDPILGETMEFYQYAELYRRTLERLDHDEIKDMTVDKIERYLKSLPPWAKRIIVGKNADEGHKAWRIFHFLEKFGVKGNVAQQNWRKFERISYGFHGFSNELTRRILRTIEEGITPEEAGLTTSEIDELFRVSYEHQGYYKLPDNFSITGAISEVISFEDLPL